MTKEEYVKKQQDEINEKIKWEKRYRLSHAFFALALPAAVVLLGLTVKEFAPGDDVERNIIRYTPAVLFEAWLISRTYLHTKTIKVLKATEIKIPTDQELANYELREFHLAEAAKLKSKIL